MNIIFYGNRQAGLCGLLTALACGHTVTQVWTDSSLGLTPRMLGIGERWIQGPIPANTVGEADLLLCVHGAKRVPEAFLSTLPHGGVNVHPFLTDYPGLNPVGKAIAAGVSYLEVCSHRMVHDYDAGEVLVQRKAELGHAWVLDSPVVGMYNALYPLYVECITATLEYLTQFPASGPHLQQGESATK